MARKKPAAPAFKDVVSERRAQASSHPRDGQSSSRVTDEGVWDADGAYWPSSDRYLSRSEVEALIREPEILVGVHGGYGRPVSFLRQAEARRLWADEVRDHFADDGDLGAGGWPEHVAYTAELRRRPDGATLLWFGGQC